MKDSLIKDAFVAECNQIAKAFTNIHIVLNHLQCEIDPRDDIISHALIEVLTGYCDRHAEDIDRMNEVFSKYLSNKENVA